MGTLDKIYNRLAALTDKTVDLSLAAALPTADPEAAARIVQALLSRGSEEGRFALVRQFHRLSEPVRALIIPQAEALSMAMTQVVTEKRTPGPANIVEIVRRARRPRLAWLLSDLLRHGEPEIWRSTSEALMELADWISGTPPENPEGLQFPGIARAAGEEIPCDGASAAFIQTAIEESLTTYRHHGQKAVLLALAALAPRPMRVANRLLSDRESAALPHMKKLLVDAGTPQIRHALLSFCRVSTLTSQAMEGIRRAVAHAKIHEVLATAHLLHAGPIARVIARLPEPEHLSPPLLDINDFPIAQAAALPTWIDALSLEPAQRVAALASLAKAPQVEARLMALRRLISVGDPERTAALEATATFCSDTDPSVARIALRHLLRNRWPGLARVLVHLINSPHADIRKLAGGQLAPLGFQRFWEAWPALNFAQQMAAGRALIKLDPGFHRLLGEKLGSQDRNTILRAMAIIFGLNQGNLFEAPLIALSESSDQVLAATAVHAGHGSDRQGRACAGRRSKPRG